MTHQYKPTRPILVERSSSSHSSFLSNIYLDPNCVIPESPTISPDQIDQLVESPITTDTTEEERELSRISSNDSGEYEDLEDLQVSAQICLRTNYNNIGGGTKPLRVKKKKGVTAVKVGSKTKKRISTPYSPSSSANSYSYSGQFPKDPTSPRHTSKPRRNPSSNSGRSNLSKTYANISSIFLNLPSPITPEESQEKMRCHPQRQGRFSDSSLHLGLGKFTSYDPISPGPSPPTSPLPSPNKRTFVSHSSDEYRKKALPIPPSPLTPSRAPRKAAALLGVHAPSPSGSKMSGGKKAHGLNTKHFRPLPNSTLTEIEKFFGDVPHKSKKPSSSKPSSKATSTSAGTGGGMDERGMGDRKVGQGETVKYKSEDGSMWLDVEEEQEFAWLLSEIFALIPQPLPDTDLSLSKIKSNDSSSSQGERYRWEMENFTSVLSLPKPKSTKNGGKRGRKGKGSDNSFLDLETPKLPRSFSKETNVNPWSHKRSLSNPTSPTKLSISPPMPALIPPPRTSSKPASSLPSDPSPINNGYWSNTPSGSGSGSDSEGSNSPPRIKNRPPPLTLKRIKPSSKLPILTATTPSTHPGTGPQQPLPAVANKPQPQHQPRADVAQHIPNLTSDDKGRYNITIPQPQPQPQRQSKKYETPSTPFVRPRAAPRPTPFASEGESIPPVPPLPISISVKEEPMSFFEPVTPTEPQGARKTNTQEDRAGKEKKIWLKRVVRRPLKV